MTPNTCIVITGAANAAETLAFVAQGDTPSGTVAADLYWSTLTLRYCSGSNLPVAYLEKSATALEGAVIGETIESVVDDWNVGHTSNEKLLICWHCKLGHFFLAWIQALMREGKDGQDLFSILYV
eukprot:12172464-Ditylum_brightwellii.AAC.1